MSKPSDVIAIAKGEFGYHEKASNASLDSKTANSGSNNWTKYARDLHNAGYYNGNKNGYAWCDVFVDWCFYQAYGKTQGEKIECQTGVLGAGTPYSAGYYKAQGRYDRNPKVGDQIFFQNSGGICHTGLVIAVDGNTVTTIEGNSNNAVTKHTYNKSDSYIAGYGHPKYTEEDDDSAASTTVEPEEISVQGWKLREGCTGAKVKKLQILLNGLGYNCGPVDGKFGSKTDWAVRSYQTHFGLVTDGIAGKQTWNSLLG